MTMKLPTGGLNFHLQHFHSGTPNPVQDALDKLKAHRARLASLSTRRLYLESYLISEKVTDVCFSIDKDVITFTCDLQQHNARVYTHRWYDIMLQERTAYSDFRYECKGVLEEVKDVNTGLITGLTSLRFKLDVINPGLAQDTPTATDFNTALTLAKELLHPAHCMCMDCMGEKK